MKGHAPRSQRTSPHQPNHRPSQSRVTKATTRPKLNQISQPATQPLSVEDAKRQVEYPIDLTDHDTMFQESIEAAREQFEHDTALITNKRSVEFILDRFPNGSVIDFPVRPVVSVSSVSYQSGGTDQELSADDYRLDRRGRRMILKTGRSWPTTDDEPESIIITTEAGYESASDVPKIARRAMLLQVGKWFADREMMMTKTEQQFDQAYERIIRRMMRASYP